jgi:hypothetical protein
MIQALAEQLRLCRTERDSWRVQNRAGEVLTPLEVAGLIALSHTFPPATRLWLDDLAAMGGFASAEPQRYLRETVRDDVDLYRDPAGPVTEKRLIIAFCGRADRLMLPVSCVLQFLPSRLCDVVVLRDRTGGHYLNGIPSCGSSLLDLARFLEAEFRPRDYFRAYCYGTSAGGFAALRSGILLRADRAISVGGQFPWHTQRLLDPSEARIPAFELLCDCLSDHGTPLYCAYGMESEPDRDSVVRLSKTCRVNRIAFPGIDDHNLIAALLKSGQLRAFYDFIFELDAPAAAAAMGS